jgi:hypothetical protein
MSHRLEGDATLAAEEISRWRAVWTIPPLQLRQEIVDLRLAFGSGGKDSEIDIVILSRLGPKPALSRSASRALLRAGKSYEKMQSRRRWGGNSSWVVEWGRGPSRAERRGQD